MRHFPLRTRNSTILVGSVYLWLLPLFSISWYAKAAQDSQGKSVPTASSQLKVETQEILLDMVVRNSRGRTILDIKPEEVEVYEDGAKQKIASFRLVDRGTAPAASVNTGESALERAGGATIPDPLRHISLVTMVFDAGIPTPEAAKLARDAALQFLDKEMMDNCYVSVFSLGYRLTLIRSFTNDRTVLRQVVGNVARVKLDEMSIQKSPAGPALSSAGGKNAQSPGPGMLQYLARIAQEMEEAVKQAEEWMTEDYYSARQLLALTSLVQYQQKLYGRKSLIYFSYGVVIAPSRQDLYRQVVGLAQRAQVSFYTVDLNEFQSEQELKRTRALLTQAAAASQSTVLKSGSAPVTAAEVRAPDTALRSIHVARSVTLASLAWETGGLALRNSNDYRPLMAQISEDLRYYYEITFVPPEIKYDGRFREISVKVSRPRVAVQARRGYYALPNSYDGPVLLPYEIPMLGVLNQTSPPHDFSCRVQSLHFAREDEGVRMVLAMEIPLSEIAFQRGERANLYNAHLSLMGLIKDTTGQIVRKISQDYPLAGEWEKLESVKKGTVYFSRDFVIPPGNYTLETLVLDRLSGRASVRRSLMLVPVPRSGIYLSSLSVLQRIEPTTSGGNASLNPLLVRGMKLTPNLGEPLRFSAGTTLSFYLVAYLLESTSGEKPDIRTQFLQNGLVVKEAALNLPPPDEKGRITYIFGLPLASFPAGEYEAKVIVRQGNHSAEEHAFFSVVP